MKREIIIIAILSAALIFLVKLFETRFLSGELSTKVYAFLIGSVFLIAGIWFGWKFAQRKSVVQIVEKEPEVKGHSNTVLTERETELVTYIARGLSNKEIAEQVFVSEHTVKKHLNNIFGKLEVSRRTQAVSKARQLGIIED